MTDEEILTALDEAAALIRRRQRRVKLTDVAEAMFERIAEQLATQDNASTSDPIFVVQRRHRQFGMDMDYCEHFLWVDDNDCEYALYDDVTAPEERAKLELLEQAHHGEIEWPESELGPESRWTRTGYVDRWEFVQPFFTRDAAEAFGRSQAHNLGEWRVYVESGYRNSEWIMLRIALLKFRTETSP